MEDTPQPRRLLVIANETCMGTELFEVMRERADGPTVRSSSSPRH